MRTGDVSSVMDRWIWCRARFGDDAFGAPAASGCCCCCCLCAPGGDETPLPDILGWAIGSLPGLRFSVSVLCVVLEPIKDDVCFR